MDRRTRKRAGMNVFLRLVFQVGLLLTVLSRATEVTTEVTEVTTEVTEVTTEVATTTNETVMGAAMEGTTTSVAQTTVMDASVTSVTEQTNTEGTTGTSTTAVPTTNSTINDTRGSSPSMSPPSSMPSTTISTTLTSTTNPAEGTSEDNNGGGGGDKGPWPLVGAVVAVGVFIIFVVLIVVLVLYLRKKNKLHRPESMGSLDHWKATKDQKGSFKLTWKWLQRYKSTFTPPHPDFVPIDINEDGFPEDTLHHDELETTDLTVMGQESTPKELLKGARNSVGQVHLDDNASTSYAGVGSFGAPAAAKGEGNKNTGKMNGGVTEVVNLAYGMGEEEEEEEITEIKIEGAEDSKKADTATEQKEEKDTKEEGKDNAAMKEEEKDKASKKEAGTETEGKEKEESKLEEGKDTEQKEAEQKEETREDPAILGVENKTYDGGEGKDDS